MQCPAASCGSRHLPAPDDKAGPSRLACHHWHAIVAGQPRSLLSCCSTSPLDAQHLASRLGSLAPASGGGNIQQASGTAGWRTLHTKPHYPTRVACYHSHQIGAVHQLNRRVRPGFCEPLHAPASSAYIPSSVRVQKSGQRRGVHRWTPLRNEPSPRVRSFIQGEVSSHSGPVHPDKVPAAPPVGHCPAFSSGDEAALLPSVWELCSRARRPKAWLWLTAALVAFRWKQCAACFFFSVDAHTPIL